MKDIGSEEDYLLHVIHNLGDSKLKSIVWHGTNSDFSKGFDSASIGIGSSAPETRTRNDFYFAK